MMKVAFQGEPGAYSEEAVRALFPEAQPLPLRENADVGQAVEEGTAECGVLPIENSLAGSVVATYDVLGSYELEVVGELDLPIHHCLLTRPGVAADELRRVLSHPVALAQCRAFFAENPKLQAVPWYDTAGAAREVAAGGAVADAAIASALAAEAYGLEVLTRNLEDRPDNQTRFFVLVRRGTAAPVLPPGGPPRTALLVDAADTPGALVQLLRPFAERQLNLSRLESRPGAEPWSYRFFMEVDASADSPAMREALAEAGTAARELRLLGSFRTLRAPS